MTKENREWGGTAGCWQVGHAKMSGDGEQRAGWGTGKLAMQTSGNREQRVRNREQGRVLATENREQGRPKIDMRTTRNLTLDLVS